MPPLFNGLEVLPSAFDKAKLFAKIFSKNSNLDDSGILLPVFHSRTNVKLHKIFELPRWLKESYRTLIRQRQPVLIVFQWWFYRIETLNFHTYQLNYSIYVWRSQIVGRSHLCKNVAEKSTAKSCRSVRLLSVVSNVFEKRVNNRIVNRLQIFWQLHLIELLRLLIGLGLFEL